MSRIRSRSIPIAAGDCRYARASATICPRHIGDFLQALGKQSISLLPGPFQELVVYAAPEIEQAQVGFRGMRPGDDSFVAPHGWRRTWIVIAYDNGDPYFIDTAKPLPDGECPIWMAMHGTGTWEPRLVASSLAQFLQDPARLGADRRVALRPAEPR